jgi:replication factor C subunit 2/4
MLGPECYRNCVLELNASDSRGIDVVRNKIKMFAQKKASLPLGRHKLVILDEADSVSPPLSNIIKLSKLPHKTS